MAYKLRTVQNAIAAQGITSSLERRGNSFVFINEAGNVTPLKGIMSVKQLSVAEWIERALQAQ